MAHLPLLKKLEEFLEKDLKGERLSFKCSTKRNELLERIRMAIRQERENLDLDIFLENQRQRTASLDRSALPLPKLPAQDKGHISATQNDVIEGQEEFYMDLNETQAIPDNNLNLQLSVPSVTGDGSGSGYESYASEDEASSRTKKVKEDENLQRYFSGTNCDVYSVVYVENKTFLTGKKWQKRIGIVQEGHLQCFKKLGDVHPVLDLPLRAYTAFLSTKEGLPSIVVNLEASGSDGDGYRFYFDRYYMNEWTHVLKEKAAAFTEADNLPAPPVAQRPASSMPEHGAVKRVGSKSDLPVFAINDKRIDDGPLTSPTSPSNDIGKGLKSAVTDIFKKKDNMKKKISMAEQLGADICGSLNVYSDGKWPKKLCTIRDNTLNVFGKDESPEQSVILHGCDLTPGFGDPVKKFVFKLTKNKQDLLLMEASNSAEMGKWVGMLIAETGCAEMPDHVPEQENVYLETDTYESVMNTARKVFHDTVKMKKERNPHSSSSQTAPPPIPEEDDSIYLEVVASAPPPTLATTPTKAHKQQKGVNKDCEPVASTRKQKPRNGAARSRSGSSEQSGGESTVNTNKKKHKQDKERGIHKKAAEVDDERAKQHVRTINVISQVPTQKSVSEEGYNLKSRENALKARKQEILQNLKVLRVKKTELNRYVEAAKSAKEKCNLIRPLDEVKENYTKLENELVNIERELRNVRRLSNTAIEQPSNIRPKTKVGETAIPTGKVASRAKIFENLEAKK
uniref:actin filament-associated protein 1 isoform X2 n=1 Tax=Ciona intestinalis TaxID=7719 RepID=UPI000EF4FA98|nr:actin filament-associated protein 1 isoform X2 [Ciona intestinalis]|eukprot:XP_026694957.1 actin filament-associated protein 1 isoform X2 [Ciona intestinalis]